MLTIGLCEHILTRCSIYSMKLLLIPQKINDCYLCLCKVMANFRHLSSIIIIYYYYHYYHHHHHFKSLLEPL